MAAVARRGGAGGARGRGRGAPGAEAAGAGAGAAVRSAARPARGPGPARAGKTEGEEADEFLGSGFGGFLSKLTEFAANSPINQGKIALVKAQAGDYDAAATQAQLQGMIDGNKVVMFSFTT